MTRTLRASLCFSLLGGASAALLSSACGVLAIEASPRASNFESDWHLLPDRVWTGERHWANRLQDWRIDGGAVECVEARPRFGMRTLHVLTHRLDGGAKEGSFRMRVIVDTEEGDRAGSAAGFLFGAGGGEVDYRLTSQVHGTSAEDGGFLALVDAEGHAGFVDFETPVGNVKGNRWAMSSAHELTDFKTPEFESDGPGFGEIGARPVALELVGAAFDGRRTLTASVIDPESGATLSTAHWQGVPATAFDGAVALVSHRGPEGAESGYRFERWTAGGELLAYDSSREFGPIMFVHYTMDEAEDGTARLGMTAQSGPLGPDDTRVATLEFGNRDGDFEEVAEAQFVPDSATFHFAVEGLDPTVMTPFRVRYAQRDRAGEELPAGVRYYDGEIAARPSGDEMTIAVMTCQKSYTGGLRWNENGLWFPHREVRDHAAAHDPDFLYFGGDQIYEGDLSPPTRTPFDRSINDYLHKWYRHGWSFGELTRRLPAVVVTDDHDVFHGNIWGNAGVALEGPKGTSRQDRGGYVMSPAFVNAVHRTQVAHLPAPYGEPLGNGITSYHTDLHWGGGSFAILSDRMYKSPPAVVVPDGQVKNGWFLAEGFDPAAEADVPGAVLLGESQESMLGAWSRDWSRGAWFKACLSQTPFANVATLPSLANAGNVIPSLKVPEPGVYVEGDRRAADTDSNGWPQTPRNEAVRLLRRAGAFHLTGDQHLGSTLRYGVDGFDDAGFVLSTPAVANTWPRRWFPNPSERQGELPGAPSAPPYAGHYYDGFGNPMTVHAVGNPAAFGVEPARLHDRAPGYGIARVLRDASLPGGGQVSLENWPRHVNPKEPGAAPYPGWPVVISLADGDGREARGYLPTLDLSEVLEHHPAIHVTRTGAAEPGGAEVLYDRLAAGARFDPPVFDMGQEYTVEVTLYPAGQGEEPVVWRRAGLRPLAEAGATILEVRLP